MTLSPQDGQLFWLDEELDAARFSRCSTDEAKLLEFEHHLMDGWRGYSEMVLHVGLCGRLTVQTFVGVDEGQILALFFAVVALHGLSTHL